MKKTICILLCMFLFLPSLLLAVSAVETDRISVYTMHRDGLQTYWTDENGNRVVLPSSNLTVQADTPEDVGSGLPTSYYAQKVTSVKNQNPTNACWTYSVLSVLESSYIMQGFGTLNDTDFSEAHLTWFANNGYHTDSSDPTAGDGTWFSDPYAPGGSFSMAVAALARGAGIATEARFPMDTSNPPTYTTSQMYVSDARLGSVAYLQNRDDIKQAVIDNGGVAVCYYQDNSGMKTTQAANSNGVTGEMSATVTAINHKLNYSPNHAVTIVGWDDEFPIAYFSSRAKPAKPGAWLCKNSWGTEYGDNGYLWISYEDSTLVDYATFSALPGNAYDSIAQYDGYGYKTVMTIADSEAAYAANIFHADKDCAISHAAFHTAMDARNYTIYIYRNVQRGSGNPTDGILAYTQTGYAEFKGYHTVKLDKNVPLQKGEYYSIVVEFPTQKTESFLIPIEGRTVVEDLITYHFDSAPATSYVGYFDNGIAWIDTVEEDYNNTCVKACLVNTVQTTPDITNPVTLVDRTTGVRVVYDKADFDASAQMSLAVFADTAVGQQAAQAFEGKYSNVESTGYDIFLYANGKKITTANHGFAVILPIMDTNFSTIRAALVQNNGTAICYFPETQDNGFLRFATDTLNGSFACVSCDNRLDIDNPAVDNNMSLLTSLKDLFNRLIQFIRNLLDRITSLI